MQAAREKIKSDPHSIINNDDTEWFFPPVLIEPGKNSIGSFMAKTAMSALLPAIAQPVHLLPNGLFYTYFNVAIQQARQNFPDKDDKKNLFLDSRSALAECMNIPYFSTCFPREAVYLRDISNFLTAYKNGTESGQSASEFLLEILQNKLVARVITAATPEINNNIAMCLEYALWFESTVNEALEQSRSENWYAETLDKFTFDTARDDPNFVLTRALIKNSKPETPYEIDALVSPWMLIQWLFETSAWTNSKILSHIASLYKGNRLVWPRSLKMEALFLARALNKAVKHALLLPRNHNDQHTLQKLKHAHDLLEIVVVYGQGLRLDEGASRLIAAATESASSGLSAIIPLSAATGQKKRGRNDNKIIGVFSEAISQIVIGATKRILAPKHVVPILSSLTGSVALEMLMLKLALDRTPRSLRAIVRPILLSLFPVILISVRQASTKLGLFSALADTSAW